MIRLCTFWSSSEMQRGWKRGQQALWWAFVQVCVKSLLVLHHDPGSTVAPSAAEGWFGYKPWVGATIDRLKVWWGDKLASEHMLFLIPFLYVVCVALDTSNQVAPIKLLFHCLKYCQYSMPSQLCHKLCIKSITLKDKHSAWNIRGNLFAHAHTHSHSFQELKHPVSLS